jgi:hypothetical protein
MRKPASWARVWPALPFVLYLALPTRNYYWDGITFAILAENRAPLRETLHPSHLLYASAATWLYRAAQAIGFHVRALTILQVMNAVLAGAAVWLIFRALRRRLPAYESAVAGALLFAFGATWWRFAGDANAYIPAVFLVLCANDLLESGRSPVLAGLAHAGAMCFHELAILYLPVVWLRRRAWPYTAAALLPVAAAYIAAWRIVSGGSAPAGFARWIVSYTPDAGFSFQPLRNVSLTLLGTLRLFFGGKPADVKPGVVTILGAIGFALAVAVLIVRVHRAGPVRFCAPPRDLLLWLAITVAFLFFWMPQNTFYRLFYFAPLVLILCTSIKTRIYDLTVPAALCGVLFCWNLVFVAYPQSQVENNATLKFALAQSAAWPPGTPIVFHRFHPDLWTISYFNPQASWIGLDRADPATLDRALTDARERHQALWVEATAYDFLAADAAGRNWLTQHAVSSRETTFRDRKREFRFYRVP